MKNKLVVIIKSLKVPKIKKILLYEMKFLVPNYSGRQNPWLGGYRPADPRSLCPLSSTEFVEPPPPPNKIPGYATEPKSFQTFHVSGVNIIGCVRCEIKNTCAAVNRPNVILKRAETVCIACLNSGGYKLPTEVQARCLSATSKSN